MQNKELQSLLDRLINKRSTPAPNRNAGTALGLDLSGIAHADDRSYGYRLAQAMIDLDTGNPNAQVGFNIMDDLYVFFMVFFRSRIGEEEYPRVRQVWHPQPGWNPIHSMFTMNTELGMAFFVKVIPLPGSLRPTYAPPPPIPQLPPAPTPVPTPSAPQQAVPQIQLAITQPAPVRASESRITPRRGRSRLQRKPETLVKPRKGIMASVARMFVGAPEEKKKRRVSRSNSPRREDYDTPSDSE